MANIYFSNYFSVSPKALTKYGAFNISLVGDMPLFVDPFLLFNSKKKIYQQLHEDIITYLRFLRDRAAAGAVSSGTMKAWFVFAEVKQNWFGYGERTNRGNGLGPHFGRALHENLSTIFRNFGDEKIAHGSHLEKLCLIDRGVGRDHISDFATNLIKEFLLDYTQTFAQKYLKSDQRRRFTVPRVRFSYKTQTWQPADYELPCFDNEYVILTPRDLLTKDETWINRTDLVEEFESVVDSIDNDQLRAQINNYFVRRLAGHKPKKEPTKDEKATAALAAIRQFPECVEYYIRYKEDRGDDARRVSESKVVFSEEVYIERAQQLSAKLQDLGFYQHSPNTYDEAHARLAFLKHVIEDQDGYRLFYVKGQRIRREKDLQIMFRLTWWGTPSDVNTEVNNGRGPADFAISRGSADKTIVELKLASNPQLPRNLRHQAEIYQRASGAQHVIKTILFFHEAERERVEAILKDLGLAGNRDIILIDAREQISASKATDETESR